MSNKEFIFVLNRLQEIQTEILMANNGTSMYVEAFSHSYYEYMENTMSIHVYLSRGEEENKSFNLFSSENIDVTMVILEEIKQLANELKLKIK